MTRRCERLAPILWGALLAGCLGGELDSPPPVQTVPKDTVVVKPPPDSTPSHDSVPAQAVHALYPRLRAGDAWVFAQWSGSDTGTTYRLETVKDSVYRSDSVHVQKFTMTAPDFIASNGYLVHAYSQTGFVYVRKTDQETVHDTLVTRMQLYASPSDSLGTPYGEDEWSETAIAGRLPDSLEDGASWMLKAARHRRIAWFFGDEKGTDDTTFHATRSYRVRSSPALTVKAGTFDVFEIDRTDSGSTALSRQWFARAARSMIRQIDSDSTYADTTEMVSFTAP